MRTVPPEQLPVDLPELQIFESHGSPEPPLEQAPEAWLYPTIDGRRYKRETNTMPQWAGSCWYYLRFLDPHNAASLVDREIEKAWMPVDIYIGGAEHAVLHLLYSRFWHKVLFDRGYVSYAEPFQRLVNQGMILGEMELTGYQTSDGAWASAAEIDSSDETNLLLKPNLQPVKATRVPFEMAEKTGEAFVLKGRPRCGWKAAPTKCQRAAATWSIPTPSCANTVPTPCGCMRCSWVRSRPRSPGAWTGSTACADSWIGCGG